MTRAIFWILAGTAALFAQAVRFTQMDRGVLEKRFDRISPLNPERAVAIRELFAEAGCIGDKYVERPVRGTKFANLVCTLKGASDETIVVSAHYDKVKLGEGAIDNWSGASLLPTLYQSLAQHPRRLTFAFVAFCEEEAGLVGSTDFVGHLPRAERDRIIADVNIDSIGLESPKVAVNRADKTLLNVLAAVAQRLNVSIAAVNFDKVGESDTRPFFEKKIPSVDLHSITTATYPLLHTKNDTREALNWDAYYDTYRLIAAFLAYLDAHPESQPVRLNQPAKR